MDMKKLSAALGLVGSITVGVWAVETRYASASDTEKSLKEKADVQQVVNLQKQILSDKLMEIEYEQFRLNSQSTRSDLEEFRLQQLKRRAEQIQQQLSE